MTAIYACAAKTGREFAVEQDLRDLGIWAWVAREVRPVKPPRLGHIIASERPMWPGYVFAKLDACAFFEARNVRHLHKTKMMLSNRESQDLAAMVGRIEAANERARREIEAGQRKTDWQPGARLEIIDGPLAQRLATFARVIDRSAERGYRLLLSVDGMSLPVEVRPEDVRGSG